jgi:CRP-like cAMP-binding protein
MQLEDAKRIVLRSGWLSRQPPGFQASVIEAAELGFFPAGTDVYSLGDAPHDLWGLVKGALVVLIAPEAVAPTLVHIATPGWWVGDTALINNTPRRVGLTAREDTWMLRLSIRSIERLAAGDPEVWRRIAQITVGHLDHALSIVAGLTLRDSHARVAMTIRRLADLDGTLGGGPATVRVSQDELGEMTRLSRNAVARILGDLETEGLLHRRYGRVEIADIGALRRYVKTRAKKAEGVI